MRKQEVKKVRQNFWSYSDMSKKKLSTREQFHIFLKSNQKQKSPTTVQIEHLKMLSKLV